LLLQKISEIIGRDTHIDEIPYYLSEVIKSDYFRLYISKNIGGVWIDLDTFWIAGIEDKFICDQYDYFDSINLLNKHHNRKQTEKVNFDGNKIYNDSYYVICKDGQNNNKENRPDFCQYILFSNKKSFITKLLYDECANNLNIDQYESIGTPMFSKIISNYMINTEYDWNKSILNIDIFAPYKWYQMDLLFEKNHNNINVDQSCCLHWFNGSNVTKKFIKKINNLNFNKIEDCSFKTIFNTYINNEDKIFFKNMTKKISIVMTYFNDRKEQTINTLDGFEKQYVGKYNFEVIIVDDNSNEENKLSEIIKKYSFKINLIEISVEEKGDRINPCVAYNKGFKEATGEIIIIQNPECYHVGDIIKYTLNNLKEQDYFSYSCFATNDPEITKEMIKSDNIYKLVTNDDFLNKNVTHPSIQMHWYNHPTDKAHGGRQTAYHYCSAIHKCKLNLINGFDERFADGYCFDDDELVLTIKHKLKLNISIVNPEFCFVIHQYHARNDSYCINKENDENIKKQKWLRNKNLFE
jgi:hypothetical protein